MKSATYYLNNIIDFADNAAIIRRRKVFYDKEKIKNCIQMFSSTLTKNS